MGGRLDVGEERDADIEFARTDGVEMMEPRRRRDPHIDGRLGALEAEDRPPEQVDADRPVRRTDDEFTGDDTFAENRVPEPVEELLPFGGRPSR